MKILKIVVPALFVFTIGCQKRTFGDSTATNLTSEKTKSSNQELIENAKKAFNFVQSTELTANERQAVLLLITLDGIRVENAMLAVDQNKEESRPNIYGLYLPKGNLKVDITSGSTFAITGPGILAWAIYGLNYSKTLAFEKLTEALTLGPVYAIGVAADSATVQFAVVNVKDTHLNNRNIMLLDASLAEENARMLSVRNRLKILSSKDKKSFENVAETYIKTMKLAGATEQTLKSMPGHLELMRIKNDINL